MECMAGWLTAGSRTMRICRIPGPEPGPEAGPCTATGVAAGMTPHTIMADWPRCSSWSVSLVSQPLFFVIPGENAPFNHDVPPVADQWRMSISAAPSVARPSSATAARVTGSSGRTFPSVPSAVPPPRGRTGAPRSKVPPPTLPPQQTQAGRDETW